jgi:DNA-directed RNA polymerase specialized sigma24 family protein
MSHSAAALDYVDSLPYIQRIANNFARRFSYDYDELLGIADELFIEIHAELPADRDWLPYLHGCLWRRWIDSLRKSLAKCRSTVGADALDTVAQAPLVAPLDLTALSDDGWLAACCALDPPAHIAAEAAARGGTATNVRSCLRGYFVNELGWTRDRVQAAFEEVGDYLAARC